MPIHQKKRARRLAGLGRTPSQKSHGDRWWVNEAPPGNPRGDGAAPGRGGGRRGRRRRYVGWGGRWGGLHRRPRLLAEPAERGHRRRGEGRGRLGLRSGLLVSILPRRIIPEIRRPDDHEGVRCHRR